jgi:hypothetical protein
MDKEAAQKAAEWWADRVCAPTFDGLTPEERLRPENQAYQTAEMRASMLVKPITAEQRATFVTTLTNILMQADAERLYYIGVDYHPCRILADAASIAGIPETNFPWKTSMWFKDGKLTVARGYGAQLETL